VITLYHAPRSRSSSILWLLEEVGEPYRIEIVPIVYGDGKGQSAPESYRHIHPHKKVPAIDHDGSIVFECAAITLYLADAFPQAGLAPATIGDKRRGPYVTWLAYWAGVMNPVVASRFRGWDKDGPTGFGTFDDMEAYLANSLEKHPYIVGDSFTAADVLVGGAIGYFSEALFPKRKAYDDYLARLADRPARQRALAKDNG
jgi:glutathione S-transferase